MAAVTVQEKKICHCFHFFPICLEVMGPDAMILVFWMLSFKPAFSLSSFTLFKRLFSSSSFSAVRVVSSAYLRLLIFLLAILIPAWHFAWRTLQTWGSYMALVVKNPSANGGDAREADLIPRLRRSLGKGMATQSSILAWRIPWIEEPCIALSIGLHRVEPDWSDLACTHSAYKLNKQGGSIQAVILLSQFWTSKLFHVRF